MTRLSQLRRRLARLRRRRRLGRLVIGYSALAVAIGWILAAIFLADWQMRMGKPERIVLLVVALGGVLWAFRRYTAPWLGKHETELDMALMVERQQHIDTDLIAALEFESPDAPRWGSVQLEQAVIERTAETARRLDPTAEVPRLPLKHRLSLFALTLVVLGGLAAVFPQYASVFFNRLLLGAKHYPTRTSIELAKINDTKLDLVWGTERVPSPYGKPVRFEVTCSGELPGDGYVELKNQHGLATTVRLERKVQGSAVYHGELSHLVDSARCLVYIGDAWTEPVEIVLVPPPVIDVEMDVTPPAYKGMAKRTITDRRQVSVPEGSQVTVRILSDKPLKEATLVLDGKDSFALAREGKTPKEGEKDTWSLPEAKSPLAAVVQPVRYTIQVTDTDGLQLERAIEGLVRIEMDYPPQVLASLRTHYVLPAARPTVAYTATDDNGLARISIIPEVIHADGREEEKPEVVIYELANGQTPQKSLEQPYRFPLTGLKLVKGDKLRVTVRAVDYRGGADREGKPGLSEPLLFDVTDEAGLREVILEGDRESEKQFNTMIENQINVGEGK